MPKPRQAKVAVVGLLLLLLLSSSHALALTLPNPPDTSAPANNQSGPLTSPSAQSFAGGISLVKDGSTDQNVSASEFVAEFFCISHPPTISKQFATAIGESISGPLSSAQTSGLIDAVNSVRPPKTVDLTISVGGLDLGGNLTYVMNGMTYNVTTYSVWATTQQSPAVEQRVGYIVVSLPERPQITRLFQDLPGSSCDTYALSTLGAGWGSFSPLAAIGNPLHPFETLPENGVAPVFTYGTVKVLSSAGVAGAAYIKPGENATFLLPPGSYSAVADVTLFGISFSVGSGTYSSPEGAATQVTVTLNSLDSVWYSLEILALAILVAVISFIAIKIHLWRALTHASKYFSRKLRSSWRTVWD